MQEPTPIQITSSMKKISLSQLAKTFLFIGVTSFGGGLTAYVRRIIVDNKKWMTNEEFFPGLALTQALPGANVVGISLYIANHLCGPRGVVVALSCLIAPPAIFSFLVAYLYFTFGTLPAMESIFKGVTAVACGLMASMFVEAAKESLKNKMDIVIFFATFFLIKKAHFSIPEAILMIAPLAIWYYRPNQLRGYRSQVTASRKETKNS